MSINGFSVGDMVRVVNVDLETYDAVGEIVSLYQSVAKVKISLLEGSRTFNYSYDSITHVKSSEVNPLKSNIAVFFEDRNDAAKFLKTGELCSEDTDTIDVVSAETLRECDLYIEKLEDEVASAIESLVFKGVLYDVKRVLTFVEVEDYNAILD